MTRDNACTCKQSGGLHVGPDWREIDVEMNSKIYLEETPLPPREQPSNSLKVDWTLFTSDMKNTFYRNLDLLFVGGRDGGADEKDSLIKWGATEISGISFIDEMRERGGPGRATVLLPWHPTLKLYWLFY